MFNLDAPGIPVDGGAAAPWLKELLRPGEDIRLDFIDDKQYKKIRKRFSDGNSDRKVRRLGKSRTMEQGSLE